MDRTTVYIIRPWSKFKKENNKTSTSSKIDKSGFMTNGSSALRRKKSKRIQHGIITFTAMPLW